MIDWGFYHELFAALTKGFYLSVQIIVPSAILGFVLGILVGAGRAVGPPFLNRFLEAYVALFRGTPLLVQLLIWYAGLPEIAVWLKPIFAEHGWPPYWRWLYLPPVTASILAFVLCSGAYHSEYIRGAILSIKKGQFMAALALGFTPSQTFWHIIIPQALRRALPGCGNEFIYLIKYSSLAFYASAMELTGAARSMSGFYARPTVTYFMAGLYYLALVTLASILLRKLETRFKIPS